MDLKINIITLIARIKNTIDTVTIQGNYVVIVCPNIEISTKLSQIVGTLISENVKFSGRTAIFPNNGKISIVCADDDVFISKNEPFKTEFIGWAAKDGSQRMLKWQNKTV